MKNKIISLLLILFLSLSLFGCNNRGNEDTTTAENTHTESTESSQEIAGYDTVDSKVLNFGIDLYKNAWLTKGYETLTSDAQRMYYQLIEENIFIISEESEDGIYNLSPVSVKGSTLTEAEIHLIISAFNYDHPQVFWLDNSFSFYTTGGTTYLLLTSSMSASEVTASAGEMKAEIEEIFAGMPGNLSYFDRELYVHDKLAEKCEYADINGEAQGKTDIYTSLGAIVNGEAVCEGYTRGTQLLLSLVGLESYYVYGRGNNELHMWNCVLIQDNWYYLDVTWDDNDDGDTNYDHFNITTEQALLERTIAPLYETLTEEEICGTDEESPVNFNIFVPECDSENMSFYAHNCVTVTGVDDENLTVIARAIADAATKQQEAVYLYIDPYYLDYDSAKDSLLSGEYLIFECISRANELLDGVTVSNETVETEESEDLYVLTIFFDYN